MNNTTYHVKLSVGEFLQGIGAATRAITTIVENQLRIERIILKIKRPSGLIINNNES